MDDNLILAGLGLSLLAFVIIAIVIGVLSIVACWKLFEKAGEPGWKSIIPLYNSYILYKICWKPMMFWIVLACSAVNCAAAAITNDPNNWIGIIALLVVAVITIMQLVMLSKAYGHGGGFAVGLVFLNTIFMLILGLGNSQYVGNPSEKEKEQL